MESRVINFNNVIANIEDVKDLKKSKNKKRIKTFYLLEKDVSTNKNKSEKDVK